LPGRRSAAGEPTLPHGTRSPEHCDDEVYVLVEIHAKLIGATDYVLPAHARGEGLLLQGLAHALCLQTIQTLRSY